MTLQEALEQGYKPHGPKRYAKLGEFIEVVHSHAVPETVMIQNTAELYAAGFRFPFERFGQWSRTEAPQ